MSKELSVRKVAQRLEMTLGAVYNALWCGRLRGEKDEEGRWRVTEEALAEYAQSRGRRNPDDQVPYENA
jgi:hypothetical protein